MSLQLCIITLGRTQTQVAASRSQSRVKQRIAAARRGRASRRVAAR
ncbi:MAG: hypothetical protein KHX99_03285 [Atopobium sp.]|nr:hypothetical protein [Atopobium sp.]